MESFVPFWAPIIQRFLVHLSLASVLYYFLLRDLLPSWLALLVSWVAIGPLADTLSLILPISAGGSETSGLEAARALLRGAIWLPTSIVGGAACLLLVLWIIVRVLRTTMLSARAFAHLSAQIIFIATSALCFSVVMLQATWLVLYSVWIFGLQSIGLPTLYRLIMYGHILHLTVASIFLVAFSVLACATIAFCAWTAAEAIAVLYQILHPYSPWQANRRRSRWPESGYMAEYRNARSTAESGTIMLAISELHIPARDTRPITGT